MEFLTSAALSAHFLPQDLIKLRLSAHYDLMGMIFSSYNLVANQYLRFQYYSQALLAGFRLLVLGCAT